MGSGDEDLRTLAQAATPGPWEWEPPSKDSWPQGDESLVTAYVPDGEQYRNSVLYGWGHDASGIDASDEDRAFIAAANPTAVLALLDRLEAAEACSDSMQHFADVAERLERKINDVYAPRMEAAEAAVERVRALADRWEAVAKGFGGMYADTDREHAGLVRAALDDPR